MLVWKVLLVVPFVFMDVEVVGVLRNSRIFYDLYHDHKGEGVDICAKAGLKTPPIAFPPKVQLL